MATKNHQKNVHTQNNFSTPQKKRCKKGPSKVYHYPCIGHTNILFANFFDLTLLVLRIPEFFYPSKLHLRNSQRVKTKRSFLHF